MIQLKISRGVSFYNGFILANINNNNLDQAWKLYEEMKSNGIQPNDVTFQRLLKEIDNRDLLQQLVDDISSIYSNRPPPRVKEMLDDVTRRLKRKVEEDTLLKLLHTVNKS